MNKNVALACLREQDYLKQVSALRFLEGLDRAENEGVVDALIAVFGTNYNQFKTDNKVRILKVIGKHLKPNDARAACAILKSINTDGAEVRQIALRSLARIDMAADGILGDKEVLAHLAAVTYADDDFLKHVQTALQGTALWVKLLRQGVVNFNSNFALDQLKSAARNLDWEELCRELKQEGLAAAGICLRICRAAKFNKEQASRALLPFLITLDNTFNFRMHLDGLRNFGCTERELADFLCLKMPDWVGRHHRDNLWEPVWPLLEAAGEDSEKAFLESLVRCLAGDKMLASGTWEKWYYELHEMLLEKDKYGFPARLKPALLSLLKKHDWPHRHNARGDEPGSLTGKIFERRAELNLSRKELEKLLTCRDAADSMVDAVKAAPDDPGLKALAGLGLKNASVYKMCEAFMEWREDLLPPPVERIERLREAFSGYGTSLFDKAWERALGKEFLLGKANSAGVEERPSATVLLICRTTTISLRFLLFMTPMPAAKFAPLLPWMEQICSDTSRREDGPHWFVAATKTEKPDSDLSRSAPFSLAEAFAVELPAEALPFLLPQVIREG